MPHMTNGGYAAAQGRRSKISNQMPEHLNDRKSTCRYIYTLDAARAHLESVRWPEGPICIHCGSKRVTSMKAKARDKFRLAIIPRPRLERVVSGTGQSRGGGEKSG